MKNIPVFTTENGAATLILKEITYSATAYILIRDSLEPKRFLEECVSFCKAVGAERIYAAGHKILEQYPYHTTILQMSADRDSLGSTDAVLRPVTADTLENWRELYNQKMASVPNAAYMTITDAKEMLAREDGYYIFRGNELLGIGMAAGNTIDAVISLRPGAGCDCMLALNKALHGKQVKLQVASTNEKAVRLYERMGFVKIKEISKWYYINKTQMTSWVV